MEELRRLSIEYYKNTVNISFFGIKGIISLLLSVPFILILLYLDFVVHSKNWIILPMIAFSILWLFAKKEYERNLIRHLSFYTHSESKEVSDQKALYLHGLTYHIAHSLFETMKIFKEIIETNNKNMSFTPDNIGYHFSRFIYDPESKNRILSLTIYLISLIAVLTVVKPETEFNIYEVIQGIPFKAIEAYFSFSLLIIIFGYFLILMSLMFIITYAIVPILLKFSFKVVLSRFFISELNRYSYLERKVLSDS